MRVFKEAAGVISVEPVWCAFSGPYLYVHDTLPKLLWLMIREWKHDRHLVG